MSKTWMIAGVMGCAGFLLTACGADQAGKQQGFCQVVLRSGQYVQNGICSTQSVDTGVCSSGYAITAAAPNSVQCVDATTSAPSTEFSCGSHTIQVDATPCTF